MGLNQMQQFEKLISESKDILLLLPHNPCGDAIGSAWAFYFFLKKNKKNPKIAFSGKGSMHKMSFLPKPEDIMHDISGARDFVLSFNTKYNNIQNVRTERDENELRIFITPQKGSIDPRDFSFIPAKFKYDLVIVMDSPDKETLGTLFENNPDVFYEIPVVNIDSHPSNDRFGQLNFVEIAASSTSEIVVNILQDLGFSMDNENINESLLAGIIDATNSFQNKNTTPKALQMSAMLMAAGADQQKIIRYLYKTQPLSILKLWGRIMARLRWKEDISTIWAPVSAEDFVQSRSTHADIPSVLEKVRENFSNGKIFLVTYSETPTLVRVIVKWGDEELMKKFVQEYECEIMNDYCTFVRKSNSPEDVGQIILREIADKKIL